LWLSAFRLDLALPEKAAGLITAFESLTNGIKVLLYNIAKSRQSAMSTGNIEDKWNYQQVKLPKFQNYSTFYFKNYF
jgi:hypothetical protein